jgi:hypothetical protein
VDAELDEELIHLAKISGVSMRVKQSGSSHWVANVESDNLSAAASWKLENFNVLAVRERSEKQKASEFVGDELVGRWVWWEKGEFRRHG